MRNAQFGMDKEYGITPYSYDKGDNKESVVNGLLNFAREHLFTPNYLPHDVIPDRRVFQNIPKESLRRRLRGYFFSNGDKFTAPPDHPEIAIAECTSIFEVAARDKASELYLWALARRWIRNLPESERRAILQNSRNGVEIYKNDTTRYGETFGIHESYTASSKKEVQERIERLFPTMLVARQALFGAGHLKAIPNMHFRLNPEQIAECYTYSQRAGYMVQPAYDGISYIKAMYSVRETKPSREEKKRIHVACGDSNMSAYATALKFGVTQLALQLIQEIDYRFPYVKNPIKEITRVADNPFSLMECSDGNFRTAFDILDSYLNKAEIMYGGMDEETNWTLDEWAGMMDLVYKFGNLKKFDYKKFHPFIGMHDTLSKWAMLQEFMESQKWTSINSERYTHLESLDNAVHLLDPYRGLTYCVQGDEGFDAECCPFDSRFIFPLGIQDVVDAMFMPPFDTRAVFRASAISKWPWAISYADYSQIILDRFGKSGISRPQFDISKIKFEDFNVPDGNRAFYDMLLTANLEEFCYWTAKDTQSAEKDKNSKIN